MAENYTNAPNNDSRYEPLPSHPPPPHHHVVYNHASPRHLVQQPPPPVQVGHDHHSSHGAVEHHHHQPVVTYGYGYHQQQQHYGEVAAGAYNENGNNIPSPTHHQHVAPPPPHYQQYHPQYYDPNATNTYQYHSPEQGAHVQIYHTSQPSPHGYQGALQVATRTQFPPAQQIMQQQEKQPPPPQAVQPLIAEPVHAQEEIPKIKETETIKKNTLDDTAASLNAKEKDVQMTDPTPMATAVEIQPPLPFAAMKQPVNTPMTTEEVQQIDNSEKSVERQKEEASAPTKKAVESGVKAKEDDYDVTKEAPENSITKQPSHSTDIFAKRKFSFDTILSTLQTYQTQYKSLSIPTSDLAYTKIINELIVNGIEDDVDALWEYNFKKLQEYKDRAGDCDVPITDELGKWVDQQRKLYAKLHPTDTAEKQSISERYTTRFIRLTDIGFEWDTPMWDTRYKELIEYKAQHGHASPHVSYPKLGIWAINQRFNIKDMSRERIAALDSLGFVWNHTRKNRSQAKWDSRYEELLEFRKHNGHCNVPATYRHSPLGTWVGKQREEMKHLQNKKSSQLDKYRIDKLNEIDFQWSLQGWKTVSWDDRYEALKRFKEKHGHVVVPRNHPEFKEWPKYQKSQYKLFKEGKKNKLTQEKVDKLIEIGLLAEKDEKPSLKEQADEVLAAQKAAGLSAETPKEPPEPLPEPPEEESPVAV